MVELPFRPFVAGEAAPGQVGQELAGGAGSVVAPEVNDVGCWFGTDKMIQWPLERGVLLEHEGRRVPAGSLQEADLHQELHAQLADVSDGLVQPPTDPGSPAAGEAMHGTVGPGVAGLHRSRLRVARADDAIERAIHERSVHGEHAPEIATRRELPGDGEAVRGSLGEQREHNPLVQGQIAARHGVNTFAQPASWRKLARLETKRLLLVTVRPSSPVRSRSVYAAAGAAFLAVAASGCGDGGAGSTGAGSGDLDDPVRVFAAASLAEAFGEIEMAFEAAHPGVDVELNLAGSSSLREQILEGAPADVFAPADESNMDVVAQAGVLAAPPAVFVRNQLAIAVPPGNPGGVTGLADFADHDLLIGLCAESVPCGALGRAALANAGVTPAIDTNETDVTALLTRIEADELDAGIVYVTDVLAAGDEVEGVEIPADQNVVAAYTIAPLAEAGSPRVAAAFVAFVLGNQGQSILASYGFAAP